jgi:dolichol-phosphate mannosyltransferase
MYRLLNFLLLQGAFPPLEQWLHLGVLNLLPRIAIATALARVLSGTVNFLVNKRFVFDHSGPIRKSLPRYLGVFFLIMTLSAVLTSSLHLWLGWSENAVKIPVDIFLFFLSYLLQRKWVFLRERPH